MAGHPQAVSRMVGHPCQIRWWLRHPQTAAGGGRATPGDGSKTTPILNVVFFLKKKKKICFLVL
jgi:hypothetical protein